MSSSIALEQDSKQQSIYNGKDDQKQQAALNKKQTKQTAATDAPVDSGSSLVGGTIAAVQHAVDRGIHMLPASLQGRALSLEEQAKLALEKAGELAQPVVASYKEEGIIAAAKTAGHVTKEAAQSAASQLTHRNDKAELQADKEQLKGDLKATKEDAKAQLKDTKEDAKVQLKGAKEDAKAKKDEVAADLQAKKDELKPELNAKKEQLKAKKDELASDLKSKKDETSAQLNAKKEELKPELNAKKEQLKGKKDELVSDLKAKKDETSAQLDAKKEQLSGKKDELAADLKAKKDELASDLKAKKEDSKVELQGQKQGLKGKAQELKATAGAKTEQIKSSANAKKEAAVAAATGTIASLQQTAAGVVQNVQEKIVQLKDQALATGANLKERVVASGDSAATAVKKHGRRRRGGRGHGNRKLKTRVLAEKNELAEKSEQLGEAIKDKALDAKDELKTAVQTPAAGTSSAAAGGNGGLVSHLVSSVTSSISSAAKPLVATAQGKAQQLAGATQVLASKPADSKTAVEGKPQLQRRDELPALGTPMSPDASITETRKPLQQKQPSLIEKAKGFVADKLDNLSQNADDTTPLDKSQEAALENANGQLKNLNSAVNKQ